MLKKAIKWLFGYRKRWCLHCHKLTLHYYVDLLSDWECDCCGHCREKERLIKSWSK